MMIRFGFLRESWAVAAGVLLAVFTGVALVREAEVRPRSIAIALVPEEVRELATREDYPLEDLWERLRTLGVSGVVLRPMALSRLIQEGQALYFSKADVEKWALSGWIGPGATVRPDTVWIRDPGLLSHVLRAAGERGISVTTQAFGGVSVLNFLDAGSIPEISVGFDPRTMQMARRLGLIPVVQVDSAQELGPVVEQVLPETNSGAVFWLARSLVSLPVPSRIGWIDRRQAWIAVGRGDKIHSADLPWPAARGMVRSCEVGVGDPLSRLWRGLFGEGVRLVAVRLDFGRDLESNLGWLRNLVGRLRAEGVSLDLRSEAPYPSGGISRMGWGLRYGFAILLAVWGPLLAVRQGLETVRRLRRRYGRSPASPVPELCGGLAAGVATSLVCGSVVYALLSVAPWRMGLIRAPWGLWCTGIPLVIGMVALYTDEIREFRARLRRPITYLSLLSWAAIFLGAAFLLDPDRWLQCMVGQGGVACAWPLPLWWLELRWREALVGYPCLVVSLWLHLDRMDRKASAGEARIESADPRPWLLLALLGPAEVVRVAGGSTLPMGMWLLETVAGAGLGLGLGGILILSWGVARRMAASARIRC